ncbi:ubiquinone anaerobic biosynthesis accessory factor UbiT [Varunaivibrio sulfuroxidans]|uniref:Putative lipid carrier protein YhbT n=1 Tax=Varunaivibrio sulfuroxidans TaxID=1773489 RepID=A0A4R3JAN8_9PROT|nr:SCP2 sterol-binding domain-containing protein [Varunaivibrio sulfuroxidans]TCS62136.1 putative lipid carrier protein YhbT [Varunaivibrio sulfuroxidans]WES30568.1 SCP2 sterol-binding domain-containing protein [Varunaivibrio sulfuroxidans]
MFPQHGTPPPFTPVLLAGIAARPLSPRLLQPLVDRAFRRFHQTQPDLFDRLSQLSDPTYFIDPCDLPFAFILDADGAGANVEVTHEKTRPTAATIRGPLMSLLDLLEGRIDGDALFFSRTLTIEGDTEAVLALRNAVDGAEVNLIETILPSFGPLSRPLHGLAHAGGRLFERARRDLELLQSSLLASRHGGKTP